MDTISFKIPKPDKKFLEWFAQQNAEPIGSIYRTATLEGFHKWKIDILLSVYSKGNIGFKNMCDLADITLTKGMLLLEENNIEPPIPDIIDEYTIDLTLQNIKTKNRNIHKQKFEIKRESDEITFSNTQDD